MLRASITLLVLFLAACAPMTWNKAGASQNDFSQDRYACLQQAQQPSSGVLVNAYGGVASSQVVTNGNLFSSCMNAKGWYLNNNQQSSQLFPQDAGPGPDASGRGAGFAGVPAPPKTNPLKDAIESALSEVKSVCAREDIKPFLNKSPCDALEISLEQMSDKSKISADEKVALSKIRAANQIIIKKLVDAFRQYGGVKGAEAAMLRERVQQFLEKNQFELYDGKINWGEYNRRRHELAVQLRDGLNQLGRP